MGMITAFKLPAELRRTFSRGKKKGGGGDNILFSLSHIREAKLPANKMSSEESQQSKFKHTLFFSLLYVFIAKHLSLHSKFFTTSKSHFSCNGGQVVLLLTGSEFENEPL